MKWNTNIKAAFLAAALATSGNALAQQQEVDQAPVDTNETSEMQNQSQTAPQSNLTSAHRPAGYEAASYYDQAELGHFNSPNEVEIEKWKNNNPAGFQRALENTTGNHLRILNTQRYDQNQPLLTERDKEKIIKILPENPNKIQWVTGKIAQTLSPEAREWGDSMSDIENNLDLADQLLLHKEGFEENDATENLLTASQTIANKHDIALSQVVKDLRLNISDGLMKKITTMAQTGFLPKMESESHKVAVPRSAPLAQPKP
jgi:hypothetical protein